MTLRCKSLESDVRSRTTSNRFEYLWLGHNDGYKGNLSVKRPAWKTFHTLGKSTPLATTSVTTRIELVGLPDASVVLVRFVWESQECRTMTSGRSPQDAKMCSYQSANDPVGLKTIASKFYLTTSFISERVAETSAGVTLWKEGTVTRSCRTRSWLFASPLGIVEMNLYCLYSQLSRRAYHQQQTFQSLLRDS